MMILRSAYSGKILATAFLLPMIPIWAPIRRYQQPLKHVIEPEYIDMQKGNIRQSKECAICRRSNADYEHSCGVAFHKACIQQYFDTISDVDGAERICPHCYAPVPQDLESEAEGAIEVSSIPEEAYDQYLGLSDEFSLALIDGRIDDVSVFLNSPSGEQYFVNVEFGYYPRKPTFSFSDELLTKLEDLDELLEELGGWDPEIPPRLIDVLLDIESRIRPSKRIEDKGEEVADIERADGKREEGERMDKEPDTDFVEVFPEKGIVEVSPENVLENGEEEAYEIEEFWPSTFFELLPEESSSMEVEQSEDSFENEEAIEQYLDLSNSFSVELVDDKIYHIVAYLSCLDAGIYNIYPITINFRDYPEKPTITLTDDLLIRIRDLDKILDKLRYWDALIPLKMVDILQELEMKLVEDSLVESEIEVISREYRTKRLGKNRIVVTLSTYGPKFFDVELDLKGYPSPPLIALPDDLRAIDIEELDGLKKWPEKPQKRIMDVLRSLSQAISNLHRMGFEELLLRMVAEEFEVVDGEYTVVVPIPRSKNGVPGEETTGNGHIKLKINLPQAYPLVHPEIEVDADDEDLKRDALSLMAALIKLWSPSMFLADIVNRLSLSLSNTSLFKCLICGQEECPICGNSLLMASVDETEEICELPCKQCKRPYHIHCVTRSIEDGITECGYCLTDIRRFF